MKDLTNKKEVPMTGQVEVFNFSQEKTPIRVQLINYEPWFVAKDVCKVLEHSNHKMAVKSLDEDEVSSVYLIDTIGRKQETKIVSESGLYSLIFQSRKPEAKKFRKWVTSEVLPAIRKTGKYVAKSRKFIAPRSRDERSGQFYDDLTLLVTHEDEREIADRFEVSRRFVHEVMRGQKPGYKVLEALVARAKANRRVGVQRVTPFFATAELYKQLVLDFYTEED